MSQLIIMSPFMISTNNALFIMQCNEFWHITQCTWCVCVVLNSTTGCKRELFHPFDLSLQGGMLLLM